MLKFSILCFFSTLLFYIYKMKTILMSIMLGLALNGFAQDSIPVYFDAQLLPVSKRNAAFNGKMVETSSGYWEASAFYPDGRLLLKGVFKDKKLRVRHGIYEGFYANGQKRLSAKFDNNELEGVYSGWHENGMIADSGVFASNVKTGLWRTWYKDGKPESEGVYAAGLADGVWKWFHENGNPATIEVYENSKLKDLTCFDESGKNTGFNCRIDKKATPANSYSFESYVIENLMYPDAALKRGVEGMVEFEFFVTKDGKLTRINFLNKNDRLLQDAVVQFLKAVPEWEPAISHNRKVDCLYTYSIPFYLP